jgi:hypothetical protein
MPLRPPCSELFLTGPVRGKKNLNLDQLSRQDPVAGVSRATASQRGYNADFEHPFASSFYRNAVRCFIWEHGCTARMGHSGGQG